MQTEFEWNASSVKQKQEQMFAFSARNSQLEGKQRRNGELLTMISFFTLFGCLVIAHCKLNKKRSGKNIINQLPFWNGYATVLLTSSLRLANRKIFAIWRSCKACDGVQCGICIILPKPSLWYRIAIKSVSWFHHFLGRNKTDDVIRCCAMLHTNFACEICFAEKLSKYGLFPKRKVFLKFQTSRKALRK